MSSKNVYEIPNTVNIDGLNLSTNLFFAVHTRRLDDQRLDREDNVLVATYPRTGTTWLCHIVSLLLAGEENYEATKQIPLIERSPYLEARVPHNSVPYIDMLDRYPRPRVDKTHLPFRFIKRWITGDRVRAIVMTRNPKDTLVSLFHFYQSMNGFDNFSGVWNDFFEHVKAGKQLYGDQLPWLQDWDRNKDKGDILFLSYEEMKSDTCAEIKKIATFLNIAISESHLRRLVRDVSMEVMKKEIPSRHWENHYNVQKTGEFLRKGKAGEWRKYFTVEQNEWYDRKYKQDYGNLGIPVAYD